MSEVMTQDQLDLALRIFGAVGALFIFCGVLALVLTWSYRRWHTTWLPAVILYSVVELILVVSAAAYIYGNVTGNGHQGTQAKVIWSMVSLACIVVVALDIRLNWRRRKDPR